jgi:hypothetical protein
MFLNTLIISSLLAFTNASHLCPQFWWPMGYFSNSVNFFTELIKGDNIAYYDDQPSVDAVVGGHFVIADRVTTAPGGARSISFLQAGFPYMQVNPDVYFSGAFTITFWIRLIAVGVVFDFKDATLANGYQISIPDAVPGTLTLISTANGAQAINNIGPATSVTANEWNFAAITFSGVAGETPVFYQNGAAAPTGSTLGLNPITEIPSSNTMARTIFGNTATIAITAGTGFSGALNDLKIYNFQMTLAQVISKFTSEQSKFFKSKN